MSSNIGKSFKTSLFGESHNKIIGVTINNIAPGINLDLTAIENDLSLRRPKLKSETARVEKDHFEIVSGYFNGYTTGSPLTILIYNQNIKSHDYDIIKEVYRPSHVDFSASKKYLGYEDYRGSGHFSGRLTAPLVIAGSIAKQILARKKIEILSHIKKVNNIEDDSLNEKKFNLQKTSILENKLKVINKIKEKQMLALIDKAKSEEDSLGASLETMIINVEAGIGEPFFNKLDSSIAYYLMSIPAIKGVSFGEGFNYQNRLGSEVSDEYFFDKKVKTKTNFNGGIIGGISTGMPIVINTVVKPASSISKPQQTIRKKDNKSVEVKIKGRHDASIFTRMPVIVDSLTALALLDAYCVRYGYMWQVEENNNV